MSYRSAQDPEENLPDWLKALRKRQSQENPQEETSAPEKSAAPAPTEGPESTDEPGWLQDIRRRYKPSRSPRRPAVSEDTPSLGDTQPNPVSRSTDKLAPIEEPAPVEELAPEEEPQEPADDLPEWLRPEPIAEPEAPLEEEEEQEEAAPQVPAFTEGQNDLSLGELPSWLQAIRPSASYPREDMRSDEMLPGIEETAGPLAGLSDVLPAQPGIVQFGRPPVFSARLEVTESQNQHAAAFERLLAAEGQPAEDEHRRVALPTRVLNIVMSVVLFMAVLFPLVTQSQNAPRPDPDLFPESQEIFNLIDVLPAQAPVLVAFDVQPALYGEMQPAITAVFTHLLEKQARLVFISTYPTGPILAEKLLQEELSQQPSVATGDYTHLGYFSGGLAALRSFMSDPRSVALSSATGLQDPWQQPALLSVDQIDDFALIVIVSSNAEDARAWIEQNDAAAQMIAITSAQAGPLLKPYLQSNPLVLRGLVSGITGGTYYELLRAKDGSGRQLWDAYSYGLGAIFLLILLGGLYGRVIHMRPEKPAPAAGGQSV